MPRLKPAAHFMRCRQSTSGLGKGAIGQRVENSTNIWQRGKLEAAASLHKTSTYNCVSGEASKGWIKVRYSRWVGQQGAWNIS